MKIASAAFATLTLTIEMAVNKGPFTIHTKSYVRKRRRRSRNLQVNFGQVNQLAKEETH